MCVSSCYRSRRTAVATAAASVVCNIYVILDCGTFHQNHILIIDDTESITGNSNKNIDKYIKTNMA